MGCVGLSETATGAAAYQYERAIDAGSAVAAMNLAQMYRHGEGVAEDQVRAYMLTKLAAERGMTPAKCNLGVMLIKGEGCDEDPTAARRWLQEAVDEGDESRCYRSRCYAQPAQGGPADFNRARAYLVPLAQRGDRRAAQLLAFIDGGMMNLSSADSSRPLPKAIVLRTTRDRRPVTPEVAGSSPTRPAKSTALDEPSLGGFRVFASCARLQSGHFVPI